MSLTYLITGASSGIGECFAQELAKAGHDLVLVARRLDRLEKLAEDLQNQFQIKCYCFSCDLSKRNETLALVEKIKSQNIEIDGLINNAGFSVAREFHNTELSAQMDFVETCVTAPTILCHAFLPQMRAKKFGRIINVSSMVAFSNGAAGHSLYPVSYTHLDVYKRQEIGCGSGRNTQKLAQANHNITAIDISKNMLEKAKLKTKKYNVNFICGDYINLEIKDNDFDFAIISLVLEHIEDLNLSLIHI